MVFLASFNAGIAWCTIFSLIWEAFFIYYSLLFGKVKERGNSATFTLLSFIALLAG